MASTSRKGHHNNDSATKMWKPLRAKAFYLHFDCLMSVLSKYNNFYWQYRIDNTSTSIRPWVGYLKTLINRTIESGTCTWVRVLRIVSLSITDHRGDSSIENDYCTLQSKWRPLSLWRISNYIYSVWSI